MAKFYAEQDVWETDVARYGIDIWMTTSAIVQGFKVCQSNLGVKIHDAKDPVAHLGPMFRQVLYVLFSIMETFEVSWKNVRGSVSVETFGQPNHLQPEPVAVDYEGLVDRFKTGFQQFSPLWKEIFSSESFESIRSAADKPSDSFELPLKTWVRILYELAATFHAWTRNRFKIIELVTPLYYGRAASFVRQTREMSSEEAESLVQEQALEFENQKDYLVEVWAAKSSANL